MQMLTSFEHAVMEKTLAGDHPLLGALREQLERATVRTREYTGVGFISWFDLSPAAQVVAQPTDFTIGDVIADIGGLQHGAGFVLFVEGGRISNLEGFTYDEPWPDDLSYFQLAYIEDPRDLELPSG